jgi:hypothetical protein
MGTKSSDSLRVSIIKLSFKAPYGSNLPLECALWRRLSDGDAGDRPRADGTVIELRCAEGRGVSTGQTLAIFRPEQ